MGQFSINPNRINHEPGQMQRAQTQLFNSSIQLQLIVNSLALKSSKGEEIKRRLRCKISEISQEKQKLGDMSQGLQSVLNQYDLSENRNVGRAARGVNSGISGIWSPFHHGFRPAIMNLWSSLIWPIHQLPHGFLHTLTTVVPASLLAQLRKHKKTKWHNAVAIALTPGQKGSATENDKKKSSSKKKSSGKKKSKKNKWSVVGGVSSAYKGAKKAVKKTVKKAKKEVSKAVSGATKKAKSIAKSAVKKVNSAKGYVIKKVKSVENGLKKIYQKPWVKYPVDAVTSFAKIPITIVSSTAAMAKDVKNPVKFAATFASCTLGMVDCVFNAGQDACALLDYGASRMFKKLGDDSLAKEYLQQAAEENARNGLAEEVGQLWPKGKEIVNHMMDANKVYKGINAASGLQSSLSDLKKDKDVWGFLGAWKSEKTGDWLKDMKADYSNGGLIIDTVHNVISGEFGDTVSTLIDPIDNGEKVWKGIKSGVNLILAGS